MSAALDQSLTLASQSEEPVYFRSGESVLFGWLHQQPSLAADLGLVICRPFGYESICSHRAVRAFATAAANIGVPCLRFDYAGSGDSEDPPSADDQLVTWTADVLAAIRELQRRTGTRRVCLLGIRLGALLATLAARQCEAVVGLIQIAPVISGRRYVRELRVVQLSASRVAVVAPDQSASDAGGNDGEAFEVSGFSLTPATTKILMSTDLMALDGPPAARVLIIDRTDLPAARAWYDTVSRLGAQTQYVRLSGLVEMVWTAPHFTAVPSSMVTAATDWLTSLRHEPHAEGLPDRASRQDLSMAAPALMSLGDPQLPRAALTERAVFFGSESLLFGVVTEPPKGEARRRGVVLVNDGATHHIGANRIYVSLARRWARGGYTVLRMDLAGLGDSATRAGRPENEVFPPAALEDMRAAIEYLQSRYGIGDITIGGLCAGAYHALRAAVAALPVNRVLMVNPQNFFWKEGMTLTDVQLADVVNNPSVYRTKVLSATSWKKVLSGKVNVWRIALVHIHRCWLALESIVRDVARTLHIRLRQDLGRELEEIVARGVQVIFIFSRGEAGVELLKILAGSSIARLGDRCRVHIIDGADHIFSQSGPRHELENILSEELFARSADRSSRAKRATDGRPVTVERG